MTAKTFTSKLVIHLAVIVALIGVSAAAYSQERSVLKVVPAGTLACLRFANMKDFDGKVANLIDSLKIPNAPRVSIAQLLDRMTDSNVESLTELEDAGFDLESDACVFWTSPSVEKFSAAIHVKSKQQAEPGVRGEIGGTDKQYKGITYVVSDAPYAWVFLEDIFVYSKDKDVIINAIETYLKEKPSILQNEKYLASVKALREGDLSAYAAIDEMMLTFLPLLRSGAEKAKENISKQMKQQRTTSPPMKFDAVKMLGIEMDMGLWILQQTRSYAVSSGIGTDGVWVNDSLKFKSDSPICNFLSVSSRKLELLRYLPGDAIMAGGATMDVESLEKFYSITFNVFMPVFLEKATAEEVAELKRKYEIATHEILSCFGDEIAFAISTKSDKMMPRLVYILKVVDEAKAEKTIGNLDYILEMAKPFYDAFGMEFQMTEGPTQKYTGVQIKSFQMDLSKMMSSVPNAAMMYPEKEFLWYAFVDGKMIYAMSQTADTIKEAVDAMNGRKPSVANLSNFEDINIRLPEKSNAVVYISPKGYVNLIMGMMMSQMGQGMPPGTMSDMMKSDIGFAVVTNLDGDGVRNFTYFLVKEIQDLISIGLSLDQMMKAQKK